MKPLAILSQTREEREEVAEGSLRILGALGAFARGLYRCAISTSFVVMAAAQPACARSQAQQDPFAALRRGDYDEAIAGLQSLASSSDDARVHRTLVDALLEVGRYDEAAQAARSATQRSAIGVELDNALGEALHARGQADAAEQAYRRAIDGGATDATTARLNLAVLQLERGQVAEAMRAFDGFIDLYNQTERLSAEELTAIGMAVRYLGRQDPQLFHDAVKAYDEAIAAAEGADVRPAVAVEPKLLMGELFLDKYDSREAQSLFREVLNQNPNHPRALRGMATAKYFDGSRESLELIKKSLGGNPNSVDALLLDAALLLDLEDYQEAEARARKALEVNPSSLDALAMLAGVHYLAGDEQGYDDARQRVLALNASYADFYGTVADLAVRHRRYSGAVDLAREAIALDSMSWSGYGILGLNQLRTGELTDARRNLERAFEGDPYNIWIKNTLDLLDTFDQYETVSTNRFELMLHGDEADLLAPYAEAIAEEAYTKLSERYGYAPETPVRVEFYPSHADFSVRTVGLAGLGALGVSFGNLLALDSPSARERGQFNWASTLWHELTHAITLGMTDHRIPRWLTEGLSVLEERRARTGWGDDVSLDFLIAYKRGGLLPVSALNNGFVRPEYPQQVAFSYYQASLVAEMIEEQHGFDAILRMLGAYKAGRTDAEAFREVLGVEPSTLDEQFDSYLTQRFQTQLAAVRVPADGPPQARGEQQQDRRDDLRGLLGGGRGGDDFVSQIGRAKQLLDERRLEEAEAAFLRAKQMFPEYVGHESPYRHLAELYESRNDPAAAAAELAALVAIDETDYDANLALANLLEQTGDRAGETAALERAVWISPYDISLHTRLAELYAGSNEPMKAVRERSAVVALEPVDMAEALYQLALAQFDAGERDAAKRTVLRALEQAPSFPKAQELLLRVSG